MRSVARFKNQDGFTAIELVVALAVSMVVFGAALGVLEVGAPQANREVLRAQALDDVRTGMARMARELRQADTVNSASANVLDVNASLAGTQQRLVYVCNATSPTAGFRACRRYTGPVNGAVSGGAVIVDRLTNGSSANPVFTYSPSAVRPLTVKIRAVVPARGESKSGYVHSVVLEDGAFMRNLDWSGS